jgi:lipopolysaccharide/colanic/teichoic acid biosynthesis glycosyltransferase
VKRAFDIAASLVALLLLSPLLGAIALAIWIEDRHSPFYRGVRVSRGGGRFRMLKFRSMRPDAWKSGVNSTASGDVRITRVGAWLRRRKLDELPQLWNVLVGEMSFVGPRPQVEADAALYTAEERRMLEARPGITDLASIVFADESEILAGSANPDLEYNRVMRLARRFLDRAGAGFTRAGARGSRARARDLGCGSGAGPRRPAQRAFDRQRAAGRGPRCRNVPRSRLSPESTRTPRREIDGAPLITPSRRPGVGGAYA